MTASRRPGMAGSRLRREPLLLLLLTACSARIETDPAVGTWLCVDRWTGSAREACPIDGVTWQLELASTGTARLLESHVEDGTFVQTDLRAERLEPGAWRLLPVPEDTSDTGPEDTADPGAVDLAWSCVVYAEQLSCAGSDAEATWEIRFARL